MRLYASASTTEEVHPRHPNCGCCLLRKVGCNDTIRHKMFVSRNAQHYNDLTAHGGMMSVQALQAEFP